MKPFHLSIGSKSIEDSVQFYTEVLPGRVVHRDHTGYVNLELFGAQVTLKDNPSIDPELPDFHFGFNLSLSEFDELSGRIQSNYASFIAIKPKVVDGGTAMERKKIYLKSPTGYLVELKGYRGDGQ